jgi:hypothetical protein
MITAKFLDQADKIVDTKFGFATDFDETLEPDQRADFQTQPTQREFDYYNLEISWEEVKVAGESTESASLEKDKEATESTKPN